MKIKLEKISNVEYPDVIEIWESAVRATHNFLIEEDIVSIRPYVTIELEQMPTVVTARDEAGQLCAFMGIEGEKIEMLFVHAGARGKGIGKQLINLAVQELGIQYVDVNEQNESSVGFYQHMGFSIMSRSETDDQGRPFPILHLRLN